MFISVFIKLRKTKKDTSNIILSKNQALKEFDGFLHYVGLQLCKTFSAAL